MSSTPPPTSERTSGVASSQVAAIKNKPAQQSVWEKWWNVFTQSSQLKKGQSTPAASAASAMPIVAVDITAVAARHPAWKLADAIAKTESVALRFDPIQGSASSAIAVASPAFDVDFNNPISGGSNNNFPTATPEEFFGDSQNSDSQAITAQGLETLEAQAGREQSESITEFLRIVAQRQNDSRGSYNAILNTALDEDVAAMQRSPLSLVSPILPSPELQLEMTNLQLQLSRNIFATDQEVKAARARLNVLLTQWRKTLRAQEQQRLAELQRLRVQEPASARRAGVERIARELTAIQDAQQNAQIAIAQEHRARLEEDFGDEQARLGITLPASGIFRDGEIGTGEIGDEENADSVTRSTPAARALLALGVKQPLVFVRTNAIRTASVPGVMAMPPSQVAAGSSSQAARIRSLRSIAWQDATKQIQMASRRVGWQWRSSAQAKTSRQRSGTIIPDKTAEILQILFGSNS